MKALIKVGYACNEHCSFCHTQDVRHIQGETDEIERKIDRAAALGHSMVVLSGGEPTIRPELQQWARRVAGHGLDLGLVTNGLMLAYPEVLQPLLAQRLRYVYMSLHGGQATVHERLVRAQSWEAANAAADAVSGLGLDFTINCVVTRHNVEHLRELVEHVQRWPDARVKFSACEPKGGGLHLMGALVPKLGVAAARVAEAIAYGRELAGADGPRFVHGGFPLCMLEGLHEAYDDLRTHAFATMVEVGEPDFFPVDDTNKIKPGACDECQLNGPCPGVFAEYHRRFGDAELRPQTDGVRGNAFDWQLRGLKPTPGDTCPLRHDGHTPWDRGRDLLIRHDGKLAHYRAEGRDFSDLAIEQTKHDQGQVYLDATRGPTPTDFRRDLVKLVRAKECDTCPHHDPCTGLFEPVFEDWFSRDDADVVARLQALRGEVLDVGCGEGPYDEIIAPMVARGQLSWTGLEPEAEAAQRVQQRRPWGVVHAVALDDAGPALGTRRFDHAVLLRSWNHLPDPNAALRRLSALVRPGGSLTVVDNVVFGLARTVAQTKRTRRASPPLSHYRNDDAHAVLRRLPATDWVVNYTRHVGPETANQWLVVARRAVS